MLKRIVCAAVVPVIFFGCARAPVVTEKEISDPKALLGEVCGERGPGAGVKKVSGSAWLKAVSKEASGRFPAHVVVEAPDKLVLEVVNLVGGTEATIHIDGRHYRIEVPAQKDRKAQTQKGSQSWGGIPLQFATELFLGKVPCPPVGSLEDAKLSAGVADELLVEIPASLDREPQIFRYSFRSWEGRPWAKALHWESRGTVGSSVDLDFEHPEGDTGSPRRWSAKSSQGEVSVRWRDREVAR